MELLDAISIFAAGLALGIFAGSYINKAERRLEYQRGQLAGINELWPHLVRAWVKDIAASHSKPAGDTPAGDHSKPE